MMAAPRFVFAPLALILLAACFSPPVESSLVVEVDFAPGAISRCVWIRAEWPEGSRASPRMERGEAVQWVLHRETAMPDRVSLLVVGHATCDDGDVLESGGPVDAEFPASGAGNAKVTMRAGKPLEQCAASGGCATATCEGRPCSALGGVCQAGQCREPSETSCADGVDNDGDGLTDCEDPQCNDKACDDGKLCTTSDRCVGGSCTGTVACASPPGACRSATGVCGANGECEYPVTPNAACTSSEACTTGGHCLPDGTCAGQPVHGGVCDGGKGVCEMGACLPSAEFSFQPSHVDTTAAGLKVHPAMTLACAATVDTNSPNQNLCGNAVEGVTKLQPGDGPTIYVLAVRGLTITSGGSLRAVGQHPLVVLVFGDARIDGSIDVSSATLVSGQTITLESGPGANLDCAAATGSAAVFHPCSSGMCRFWTGGGGAGHVMTGGRGAALGTNPDSLLVHKPASPGGMPRGAEDVHPLLGGCKGGSGGTIGGLRGTGGNGGGAIALAVAGTLEVDGLIHAGGAGGLGGDAVGTSAYFESTGGGGGGSGGAIVLEAEAIRLGAAGRLVAAGGAGGAGAGSNQTTAVFGASGQNGRTDGQPAAGGGSPGGWGTGGSGGTHLPPGDGLKGYFMHGRGSGGGGGSAGRIRIHAQSSCSRAAEALISPAAMYGGAACAP